jgi:hypothetical protein
LAGIAYVPMFADQSITVGCRVPAATRRSLQTLAIANGVNVTDLLRRLIDGALADVPVALQPPPEPLPPPPDPTAAIDALRCDVAGLRSAVAELTTLVRTMATTPMAAPALTLNVPGLDAVGALAQRHMAAADAAVAASDYRRTLALLTSMRNRDADLTVRVVDDTTIWAWKRGLGNAKRAADWLDGLADNLGFDPRPFIAITPDARDADMGYLVTGTPPPPAAAGA